MKAVEISGVGPEGGKKWGWLSKRLQHQINSLFSRMQEINNSFSCNFLMATKGCFHGFGGVSGQNPSAGAGTAFFVPTWIIRCQLAINELFVMLWVGNGVCASDPRSQVSREGLLHTNQHAARRRQRRHRPEPTKHPSAIQVPGSGMGVKPPTSQFRVEPVK